MRDLNVTIEGSWWDTLLYKGKLHALTAEGDWQVFDWDAITSRIEDSLEKVMRPAFHFSFRASNAINKGNLHRDAVAHSFNEFKDIEFIVSAKELAKHTLSKTDASISFPSTSMGMHYDRMIISSLNGVYVDYVNPREITPGSLKKMSSIATRQVSAAYGKVACASGDAGLRQLDLQLEQGFRPSESDGAELSSESCDACDWMYQNISCTSYRGSSFLAKFKRTSKYFVPAEVDQQPHDGDPASIEKIEFCGSESLIDPTNNNDKGLPSVSWGSHDKIYKVEGRNLESFRFTGSGDRRSLGKVQLPGCSDEIVSVRSALFGVVIEFDESVVVVKGDGSIVNFEGEPVNISTFSRSKSYENQLHMVMDDHVKVVSINSAFEDEGFYVKKFGSKAPSEWFG